MRIRDRVALGLADKLGPPLFRATYSSLRFDVAGDEHLESTWRSGLPVVFITWHGRILPLLYLFRDHRIVMLVSQHRDGEYLARIGHGLGYESVRGSSTRGGFRALRDLVRQLRCGRSLAITPDGPQGPREQLKPGALQAARITEAPVVPVMAGSRQSWWVEGWDSFMIPRPFAEVRVAVGEPRQISRDCSVRDLVKHAELLESQLRELKGQVDGEGP